MKLKTLLIAGMVMIPITFAAQNAQAGYGSYCKNHTKTVRVNGNIIAEYYKTCLQPDGSWVIASHSGPGGHRGGHYDDSHHGKGYNDNHHRKAKKHVKKHAKHAYKDPYYHGYRQPYRHNPYYGRRSVKHYGPGYFRKYYQPQRHHYQSIKRHNHRHTQHCGHGY